MSMLVRWDEKYQGSRYVPLLRKWIDCNLPEEMEHISDLNLY